jgi:hypothetical protein
MRTQLIKQIGAVQQGGGPLKRRVAYDASEQRLADKEYLATQESEGTGKLDQK